MMMIELPLTIPAPIHERLQTAAKRGHKSVNNLLVELVSQRFPVSIPPPSTHEHQQGNEDCCRFVTEWVLPDRYEADKQDSGHHGGDRFR